MADNTVDTTDVLGTLEPNLASKPHVKVVVDDEDWSDAFLHGEIELWGVHRNGTFCIDFDLDHLGNIGENDNPNKIEDDSRLGKILKPHITPVRNIIQISLWYNDDQPTLVLDGVLDNIEGQQDKGIVTFRGRDRSAILQESFTHAQFRNQTVAGAVREIAEKHGLELEIVDPGTKLGTVFDQERMSFEHIPSQGYNDWDLLNRFADYDAYSVFVTGKTLHYLPIEDGKETILFKYGNNIEAIQWRKNYSVAQSRIGIQLISTNVKKKDSGFVVVGTATGAPGKGDSALYRYTDFPSQDPEVLGIVAESLALLHAQFEFLVTVETTGSLNQKLSNKMAIEDTGTIFDHEYRIQTIRWKFGTDYGWKAEITGLFLPDGARLRAHRKTQKKSLSRV